MSDEGTVISYLTFLRRRIAKASREDLVMWVLMESRGIYARRMVEGRTQTQLQRYLLDRLAKGEWDGPCAMGQQQKGGS